MALNFPVQFMNPDDFQAHEARVCIAEGYVLGDTRRPKHYTAEQYFKTQEVCRSMCQALAYSAGSRANTRLKIDFRDLLTVAIQITEADGHVMGQQQGLPWIRTDRSQEWITGFARQAV